MFKLYVINLLLRYSYYVRIKWITKKVKQLFKLKSKSPHPPCVICEDVCAIQEFYISETKRNVEIRWEEHRDTMKDSEPAKHMKSNPSHKFSWKILMTATVNDRTRKKVGGIFDCF